jgi:predicted AAA+ superfamily ATPase
LFGALRAVIDTNRRNGRRQGQFVILGSASPVLLNQSGESLAGRLAYTELCGVDLLEAAQISVEDSPESKTEILNALWLRGGFPDSFLATTDKNSYQWRREFVTTYLLHDIPGLGPAIATETPRRF